MTNRLGKVLIAIILAGCACVTTTAAIAAEPAPPAAARAIDGRERINIDKDWRFAHGHAYDAQKDFRHGLRPFFLSLIHI